MTEIKTAIIVGGGIAGVMTAYSLYQRGYSCTILEKNDSLMSEASGNKKAIINPVLSHESEEHCAFLQSAFIESTSFYQNIPSGFSQCGAIQLAVNKKIKKLICDMDKNSVPNPLANVVSLKDFFPQLDGSALFYPLAGILTPKEILKYLLEHSSFTAELQEEVIDFEESISEVVVKTQSGRYSAQLCIFANSYYAAKFFNFPLEAVRGEVVEVASSMLPNIHLTLPLCFNGYLIPLNEAAYLLGSTYDHGIFDRECNFERQNILIDRVKNIVPNVDHSTTSTLPGRVSFRASTPDKLPIVGPVRRNSRVFVNIGHGSRGFQTAVTSARFLSDFIIEKSDIPKIIDASRDLDRKSLQWKRYPWECE